MATTPFEGRTLVEKARSPSKTLTPYGVARWLKRFEKLVKRF